MQVPSSTRAFFSGCDIGAKSRLHRVILDSAQWAGTVIGEDRESITNDSFITPTELSFFRGTHIPKEGPIECAHDMAFLLEHDKATQAIMRRYSDRYKVSDRNKHSHDSAGPRYSKYGPQDR